MEVEEIRSGGTKNEKTGNLSSPFSVPAEQASGYMSTPWKTSQRRFTPAEKARILERVPFKSEKPFFKILMQPSYFGSKTDYLVSFPVFELQFTPNCNYISLLASKLCN